MYTYIYLDMYMWHMYMNVDKYVYTRAKATFVSYQWCLLKSVQFSPLQRSQQYISYHNFQINYNLKKKSFILEQHNTYISIDRPYRQILRIKFLVFMHLVSYADTSTTSYLRQICPTSFSFGLFGQNAYSVVSFNWQKNCQRRSWRRGLWQRSFALFSKHTLIHTYALLLV